MKGDVTKGRALGVTKGDGWSEVWCSNVGAVRSDVPKSQGLPTSSRNKEQQSHHAANSNLASLLFTVDGSAVLCSAVLV